jgi:hypothetical protein
VRLFEGGPEPIVEQAGGSPATQADRLVFDSGASVGGHQPAATAKPGKPPAGDGFRRVQSFTLGDRVWEVEVSAPAAEVVQPFEQWLPLAILVAGIVIGASLSGVLLLWARGRGLDIDAFATAGAGARSDARGPGRGG